jgi:hypothetical protein
MQYGAVFARMSFADRDDIHPGTNVTGCVCRHNAYTMSQLIVLCIMHIYTYTCSIALSVAYDKTTVRSFVGLYYQQCLLILSNNGTVAEKQECIHHHLSINVYIVHA